MTEFALLLGAALSVSAIPVIAKILTDLNLLRTTVGQVVLATGTITDIGAWVILAVVSALATAGLGDWHFAMTLVALVAVIVVAVGLRPVVGRLLDRLEASSHSAQVHAVVVLMIVGTAAATNALHLEAAFGAFVAGVMIGTRGEGVLTPLTTVTTAVLAPVFLALAGLHLDVGVLGDPVTLGLAALILTVAVVGKIGGSYLGARLAGVAHWESAAIGSGLNARGLVEIILATIGLSLGVFTDTIYMIVVLLAIVTSIMAGPVLAHSVRRMRLPQTSVDEPAVSPSFT